MADEGTPPEGGQQAGADGAGAGEFKPITSQDELDKIIGQRLTRERARFSDYDDLKAQAGKVSEWETKATELESALPGKVTASLRDALVTLGVVSEPRKALLTANDPAGLLEQVKAIQDIERSAAGGTTRRATPPGKPAPEDGKGRAAAALRELRGAGRT